jgi:RNA polymerase sigma-70 factor (ECF subfamily)
LERDDQTLVSAVGRGDPQAFELIYRKYKNDLFTSAVYLLGGDRSGAEDVLHDVFIAFARRAAKLRLTGSLRNYLITTCLNRARDVLRRRQRRVRDSAHAKSQTYEAVGPYDLAVTADESDRLRAALALLPDEQREIVTLHVYGQLKFREIAELVGDSINTVTSRYRYALRALRSALEKAGVGVED